MTEKRRAASRSPSNDERRPREPRNATWKLEDAKAKFSEVVRRAHDHGPQYVTVRGKPAVAVIDVAGARPLVAGPCRRAPWSIFSKVCISKVSSQLETVISAEIPNCEWLAHRHQCRRIDYRPEQPARASSNGLGQWMSAISTSVLLTLSQNMTRGSPTWLPTTRMHHDTPPRATRSRRASGDGLSGCDFATQSCVVGQQFPDASRA